MIVGERLDDGAHLTPNEAVVGHVGQQRDDIVPDKSVEG